MDDVVRMGLLYDFYGGLLTKKQQRVFGLYYLENLSLAEIAEEVGTTRQAVHDLLQRTEKLLSGWESKLGLVDRYLQELDAVQGIKQAVRDLAGVLPADERVAQALTRVQKALRRLISVLELEMEGELRTKGADN
ncbi:MAG: YlxM family DNA-binding protein [Firmicutes bacterium]|nr:YlxM family DNA-binding protein [Bacillota bacterium]